MKPNTNTVPLVTSTNVRTASANIDVRSPVNSFQNMFDRQKRLFATGVTRTYEWRVDQLDRMGRMIKENEAALQRAVA
jgi:hypothetical protein